MLVSAVHFGPIHRAPEANARRLLALITQALEQGARLVVAPELCLTGFAFATPDELRPYAQAVEGPFGRALARLSLQYSSTIVAGIAELGRDGLLYNTALIATARGDILSTRMPRYAHTYGWMTGFGDGTATPSVATPLGPLRVVVCAGLVLDAPAAGGGILAVPASWNDEPPGTLVTLWQRLARERGSALIIANRYGRETYSTGAAADFSAAVSCVINSSGVVAARSDGDQRDASVGADLGFALDEQGRTR